MNIHSMRVRILSTRSCPKRKKGARKIKYMGRTISRTSPKNISLLKKKTPKGSHRILSPMMSTNRTPAPGILLLTHRTVSTPPMSSFIRT